MQLWYEEGIKIDSREGQLKSEDGGRAIKGK